MCKRYRKIYFKTITVSTKASPLYTDNIIYFPIAFKTKCYLLIGVDSYGYNMLVLNNPTLNNFKAYGRGLDGNLSLSAVGGYGIFIGK